MDKKKGGGFPRAAGRPPGGREGGSPAPPAVCGACTTPPARYPPHLGRAPGRRNERRATAAERERFDVARMAPEDQEQVAARHVPDFDRGVKAGAGDPGSVGAVGEDRDEVGMYGCA